MENSCADAGIETTAFTREELEEELRPIASLISKSEKARLKLRPGTWQHTMLEENLRALRIAAALMEKDAAVSGAGFAPDALQAAQRALESMTSRTANTKTEFAAGTSQHTLQNNRLRALQIASVLVQWEIGAQG